MFQDSIQTQEELLPDHRIPQINTLITTDRNLISEPGIIKSGN